MVSVRILSSTGIRWYPTMIPCEYGCDGDNVHHLCLRISSILNLLFGSTVSILPNISFASYDKVFGTLYSPDNIFW